METGMSKIGFIGLGTMGGPMAANLVKGGYSVKGYDISSDLIKRHTDSGGIEAKKLC
jgi:3-hydroxyisobutyrate dehydrogenase-like beta-hydroxyacid dehydrogenase